MASHILSKSEEEAAIEVLETVTAIQRGCLLGAVGLGSLVMGCTVTADDFTQCVKKSTALWLTMSVVVFFAPLTAYILTISLHLHFSDGVTLLITACCPSDILSPIFAYYTNSDTCFCLTVFVLSTTMSVGWIPLGVFFCSSAFPALSLAVIPHDTIVIILLEGVGGLGVGMLFRKFKEHWADNFAKVFSWTPLVPVIAMIVIDGILLPHSIHSSKDQIIAVTIYVLVVLSGTYIVGLLAGQEQKMCRAMAFCAGNKSSIVVLTIIHDSYAGHVLVEALPEPTLLLIVFIGLGGLLSLAYQTFHCVKNSSQISLVKNEQAGSGVPYDTLQSSDKSCPSSVPESADVVVIGGGSIGCSTLYHLAKMGVTNAVLLERDQLTSGTTWHTGGLVWNLRPSDIEVRLLKYMAHLVRSVLEPETGIVPGWIENGGLFIANNKERLDEYKRLATLGKVYGIESYVLSAEETKKLYPLLNTADIYGTLYSPSDGSIDPAGFCTALTRGATRNGAKVITNCPVTGILVGEDDFGVKRVKGVETVSGTIKTPVVVNAAGVWAPYIGQMAGVSVPLTVLHHHYVVSERIEGIHGMPNVRDHDASVYLKVQGDGIAFGGYESNPIYWKDVKNDFAFSLFELDWDVFGFTIDGAVNRLPVLETTGIKSTVCGPESFTPDHKPLMGETPEVRGFYLNCAMNSSGLMLGGGTGKEMAHWIINGRPELDMYGYDIRRFHPKVSHKAKWVDDRSQEAYAKNYSTVFPHDEPLAGRGMRKDAVHKVLEDTGCVYQERLGWERPGWFATDGLAPVLEYDYYGAYNNPKHENHRYAELLEDDYTFDFPKHHDIIGNECLSCRNGVGIFNMSYFGQLYLTGPDAQKAADWIFTNDMTKSVGSTMYTCALNKDGGVESDLTVSVIESGAGSAIDPSFGGRGFYVAAGGGVAQHVKTHMQTAIQDERFDCTILDHSDDMGVLSIQGPKSREVLASLTSIDLSNEAFPFNTHKLMDVAGHTVRAIRLSFVGELGWELHVDNETAVPVYQAVMEAGAQFGITNGGYRALDSLSLEKGYHLWRTDLRPEDTPLESGLGFVCKLKKDTPFLGRGAVEKQKAEGIRKKRVCFTIDEHLPLLGFECIRRNNEVVGFIRRGEFGYYLNKNLGYGYVSHPNGEVITNEFLTEGNYTIERMGEVYQAQIHLKSPFDPQNKRIKGIYE